MTDISALIREGMDIKARMDADKKRLQNINKQLADIAEYKEGSNTGHIYDSNLHVKVQRKTNVKWDQKELNRARTALGDDIFFEVFKWKYEPASKKALDGFMQYGDKTCVDLVRGAMTETPGTPAVEYELLEEVA